MPAEQLIVVNVELTLTSSGLQEITTGLKTMNMTNKSPTCSALCGDNVQKICIKYKIPLFYFSTRCIPFRDSSGQWLKFISSLLAQGLKVLNVTKKKTRTWNFQVFKKQFTASHRNACHYDFRNTLYFILYDKSCVYNLHDMSNPTCI